MKRKIAALLVSVLVATSVPWPVSGVGGINTLAAETQNTVESEIENQVEDTESKKEEDNNGDVVHENDENNNEQGVDIISETESDSENQEEGVEISEEENVENNQENTIENEEKIEETLRENEIAEKRDTSLATNSEVKNLDEKVETDKEPESAVTTLTEGELTYQLEGTDAILYYTVTEDKVTITGCELGETTSVVIPEMINGDYVISVESNAFSSCSNLSEIKLPDGLTTIGNSSFLDCWELTKIELPDTLTSIGDSAFAYCGELREIKLPEGLTNIGNGAFSHSGLTKIELPNSLTSIGDSVFFLCDKLEEVILPEYLISIGENAFENCNSLREIYFPDTLKSIGRNAFNSTGLRQVELPNSLVDLSGVFFQCHYLTKVKLPDTLTSIGHGAFGYCTELTEIELPDTLTSIGDFAFECCSKLTEIELPTGLTNIGDSAFAQSGLEQIKLPNTVTSMGKSAFYGCFDLVEIELSDALLTIGDSTFSNCPIREVSFPNGLTSIGESAFFECLGLEKIWLPDTVTSIGDLAFYGCMLRDIYYAGSEEDWKKIETNLEIPEWATLHFSTSSFEDSSQESTSMVRIFTGWDNENKMASFFPSWESGATEKTDMSFLDNLDSLLNNYVLVTTESDPEVMFQDNLISLQPVETKRGIITEISGEHIVIDGTTYQFAECYNLSNLAFLSEGGDVVYHLLDGRICEVDSLTWTKTGWLEGSTEGDVLKYHRDLSTEIYRVSPLAATQIRKKLAQYEKDNTIKILTDSLNMAYDVAIGETDDNFENCITKFVSYNQDTKEVTTYDNKTYILPESLYTEDLLNQWVEIFVSIEKGNVIESIERFKPNIFVNIELLNQGPIYVSNGKYSYDGKDYHDRKDFAIPFYFTVENQEYTSAMVTPEMMIMMQSDGVDFDVSLNKLTFDLPNNFGWIENKEIKLESDVVLKPGEKWTAEGAITPQFFDSLNDDAEREELIQVAVKWNDSEEDRVISFTLKNMEKVEKALAEIEKGSEEIAEKAEKVDILKLQTSGLVTEKQLEEINASVAIWLSTITNPDCPTAIKKGMFDSYEYNIGNRTIKSTFKIPVEVADGNTIKKVNFVFRTVIQDFDFSGIWEQVGLKLGSLGTFSTLEWKVEGLSKYNHYQLCSIEASANIGNLNSAISEYAKSAVKEIKEVLTSTDSLPFNEAIENLPAPESYLTSLIRTMLINIVKGDNAITPKEICEWMEGSYGKIIKIKCPVDVYVYHEGVECARIVNNQLNEEIALTNLGSIASVSGNEKTLVLLGGDYEIELVGNDTGTMDYIVEEYSNFGSGIDESRIIKFDNLPLTKGMKYTGYIDDQILQPKEEYALESDRKSIIPDYDTLEGDEIKDLPSGIVPDDGNSSDSENTGSTGSGGNSGSGNSHTNGGSSSGSSSSGNSSLGITEGTGTAIVSTAKGQNNPATDNATEASAICSCEEKCDSESINSDCPICSLDYTKCVAGETDTEAEKIESNNIETEQNDTGTKDTDTEAEADDAADVEALAEKESDVSIFGLALVLLVVLLGSGAAIYYFKVAKSEQKHGKGHQ